jgi:hypothetical protein
MCAAKQPLGAVDAGERGVNVEGNEERRDNDVCQQSDREMAVKTLGNLKPETRKNQRGD